MRALRGIRHHGVPLVKLPLDFHYGRGFQFSVPRFKGGIFLRGLLLWTALTFSVAIPAAGQSNFATLSGSINDVQSRPIRDARIQLRSNTTDAQRLVMPNIDGLFEISALMPGEYRVDVEAPGFAPVKRQIRLEVGQQMRLDLMLTIGKKIENLDVIAQSEILKTGDVSLGEVVETKSIQELPLNGRMLMDLALTVPGAHIGHGAQTGDMNPLYWRPGQRSAITIGGNRPNANYFLVDSPIPTPRLTRKI
jgi:Carboxypeptidase regulatory-like domain